MSPRRDRDYGTFVPTDGLAIAKPSCANGLAFAKPSWLNGLAIAKPSCPGMDWQLPSQAARMDWQLPGQAAQMDWQLTSQAARMDWQLPGQAAQMDWQLPSQASRMDWQLPSQASWMDWQLPSRTGSYSSLWTCNYWCSRPAVSEKTSWNAHIITPWFTFKFNIQQPPFPPPRSMLIWHLGSLRRTSAGMWFMFCPFLLTTLKWGRGCL